MVRINQKLDSTYRSIDNDASYQKILETISKKETKTIKPYFKFLRYAAMVILIIGLSIGIRSFYEMESDGVILELADGTIKVLDENNHTTIANKKSSTIIEQIQDRLIYGQTALANGDSAYHRLTVPNGKRFSVTLSDGSTIMLNSGTELKYPESFKGLDSRRIYLNGEAYFDVKENKEKPFIVRTKRMSVRVLGTEFNISSYSNESSTSVVLKEGSVRVYRPSQTKKDIDGVVLMPGQQAKIEKRDIMIQKVNVDEHLVWTEGKLSFVDERFEDILKELERHYDIDIENRYPELNNRKYTGSFTSETVTNVLEVFKEVDDFDYSVERERVTITPIKK